MTEHWTIKPLEWEREESEYVASTIIGQYLVCKSHSGKYLCRYYTNVGGGDLGDDHSSVDNAKHAAQEHYKGFLTGALSPVEPAEVREES